MKKTILVALLVLGLVATTGADGTVLLNAAGATFPYPIYSKWFDVYHNLHPNVQINYQSIGSGGGIRQLQAGTVDFGASDGPMTDEQLSQSKVKILHFPTVLGAVVPTYNIPGVSGELNFTQQAIAGIYLGKITKWNDPEIVKANSGVKLPNDDIVVVHRSDGSGTSFIFTDYLSSISSEWKGKVGKGTSVNWPLGLGGKGNEGVSGLLKQSPGSIGYVELAYAKENNLTYAYMQNKSGDFIEPNIDSTSQAAVGVNVPADFRFSIVNSANPQAYPIAGMTWLLIYKQMDDRVKAKAIVDFIKWAITDGQKLTADLDYAPLPSDLVDMIQKKLDQVKY
jgi:phosphate transport system substrate-binding protein